MLRDADLFHASLLLGLAAAILRVQLGNFEYGEGLAGVDAIADVDVDVAHVAGDLCVYIDDLIGLKLPGEREHVRDVAALDNADGRSGGLGGCVRGSLAAFASGDGTRGGGKKEKQ
jgi:hypothetical protein